MKLPSLKKAFAITMTSLIMMGGLASCSQKTFSMKTAAHGNAKQKHHINKVCPGRR